ncbi:Annexin [Dothidotthia symphoricarpi CBS 119687]|uniref:Annexin n=1 Tax=Dothidotthia symphoricarpi CBS 119687 TaxID=1392245 RepID=A0A6A6ALA0_9PLEO|nr:Annexin [Dothidotthia symphoricarpi CBS 119687]KAF2131973.1 Annexin [Dothidotthia symphoricarpi CBS 119687]
MSLRPKDKRSRSKSPGRGRTRSHSSSQAHHSSAAAPQYEVRQPGGQPYATTPQNNVQYAPIPPQFAYTATPASHAAHARTPSTGGNAPQYAQPQPQPHNSNAFNASQAQYAAVQPSVAQPVYAPQPPVQQPMRAPPPMAPQPMRAPPQTAQQPVYAPQPPAQPTYAQQPQAQQPAYAQQPAQQQTYAQQPVQQTRHAPSPTAQQPMYAQPPMGSRSPRPEHHRAMSQPIGSYDGRKLVEIVPGGGGGGGNLNIATAGRSGGFQDGALPPPSPLLEAYHGTYQSISPMPQAMMLDDDLSHLSVLDSHSPRSSSRSRHGRHRSLSPLPPPSNALSRPAHNDKLAMEASGRGGRPQENEKRRVKAYDATEDAFALVDAMAGRAPNPDPMIDILPALSHDEMLELRSEYKRHCKVQGRGINIAKHIKLKTTGSFGKVAYVTALGKYEGEGYWANYWYQSHSARRELLIEALMGRQNHEMREIKAAFKDKRYGDSLTRCMDKELKADKFRKAVLMTLEGERQEETDVWPPEYVHRDVDTLYKAIKAREGGESTILSIVLMRSDAHLREVLRTYERVYQGSFARDALRKSNNLVGEVVAHILNGVINRPARDAMLLHHALMDLIEPTPDGPRTSSNRVSARETSSSKHERQQRVELLISRLVRLHWDRAHLMRVQTEYEEKYGRVVEEDLEEATKGDFREFCIAICQSAR